MKNKPVTPSVEKLATNLNGSQYPIELNQADIEMLKYKGLVVVQGNSDGQLFFSGAINDNDDQDYWLHTLIDSYGVLPADSSIRRVFSASRIELTRDSRWDLPEKYITEIPHRTFNTFDGLDAYGVGMVFSIDDVKSDSQKVMDKLVENINQSADLVKLIPRETKKQQEYAEELYERITLLQCFIGEDGE